MSFGLDEARVVVPCAEEDAYPETLMRNLSGARGAVEAAVQDGDIQAAHDRGRDFAQDQERFYHHLGKYVPEAYQMLPGRELYWEAPIRVEYEAACRGVVVTFARKPKDPSNG